MSITRFFGAALGCAALLGSTVAQAESIRPGQSLVSASAAARTPAPALQSRRGATLEETNLATGYWSNILLLVGTVTISIVIWVATDDPESP